MSRMDKHLQTELKTINESIIKAEKEIKNKVETFNNVINNQGATSPRS
jgi:hypothetical protein